MLIYGAIENLDDRSYSWVDAYFKLQCVQEGTFCDKNCSENAYLLKKSQGEDANKIIFVENGN